MKILIVRKIPALEFFYNGSHASKELNEGKEEHDSSMQKIENILTEFKCEYDIVTRKQLTELLVSKYDFVFSCGGDGTVIATAAYNKNTPQLNLKTDQRSAGVLCEKNIEDAVRDILSGDYGIEKWVRQDVYLDKRFIGRALNETCIGELLKFFKMARYEISFTDLMPKIEREDYHENSGIVIATGTGSTGWPDLFEKYSRDVEAFVFKTIIPSKRKTKKGRIKSGEGTYFKIKYKGHEGKFAIDTIEYDFPRDSVLELKISRNPLKVAVPIQ
ncbi:hypothetical protein HZA33_04745 [Candidatus Pacearchaeota archaeon]|nr:hypothetical protein [Candidatus Pacearchaeota archaeon]